MEKNYTDLFHLPEGATFLNCAYMAPLLKSVEEIGIQAIKRRRNLHTIKSDDFFTDVLALRKEFAGLINADASAIALIPSVSYGIANVLKNLPVKAGQNIVLAGEQFPSNYYPWESLALHENLSIRLIDAPDAPDRARRWNELILESIDESTCAVGISAAHWADGTLFNLHAIRKKTSEVGAWLVIDGTQSVGALPFDVAEIRPDALVCAGYKWLMGPYSMGLAYYGQSMANGRPVEENWINRLDSEDFQGLVNYTSDYQSGAMRYSVGEHSNFILVPMLLEAIRTVRSISPERIQSYTADISKSAFDILEKSGFRIEEAGFRANHIVGVRLPEHSDAIACANALADAKIVASWRGNALRIFTSCLQHRKRHVDACKCFG